MRDPLGTVTRSARRHGIHPLFALGGSTPSFPGVDFMPDAGPNRFEQIGAVGRALERFGEVQASEKSRKGQKEQESLRSALIRAEIEKTRTETGAIAAQAAASVMDQPGIPKMYTEVYDNLNKRKVWLPNPDLGIEMPETVGAGYWARGKTHDRELQAREGRKRRAAQARAFTYSSGPCKGMTGEECYRRGKRQKKGP